jgi:hypothetical protein
MIHTATMSQNQKALASRMGTLGTHEPSESTWLLIQGTRIEMKECLGATAALKTEITFPKVFGRCKNAI